MEFASLKTLKSGAYLVLLLAGGLPAQAQTAPAPAEPAPVAAAAPVPPAVLPDGLWKGPLKVPGGQLEVIFRTVKLSSGNYFATLDVPLQKVSRMAVSVEMSGDTVRLVAPEANSQFTGLLAADRKQLAGTWQQPGFKTPVTLSFAAAPAPTALAKNARLTPPYREEEVSFSNAAADLRLGGELTLPPGAGPFPTVVLLSDGGPHDRNGTVEGYAPLGRLADYLTRRGIAVLRYDDRGVGKSTGAPGATTAELVTDAQAALNYLRTRPEVDLTRLGLIGHGEGGNVALLAAGQALPPSFVVTLAASGLSGADLAIQQQTAKLRAAGTAGPPLEAAIKRTQALFEIIRLTPDNAQAQSIVANMLRQNNPDLTPELAQSRATELTSARYRHFLTFNPVPKLTGVTCPVLLLHGAADQSIEANSNMSNLQKGMLLHKKNVTEKILPGVNHLFQPAQSQWPIVSGQPQPVFSPQAEETIRGWIASLAKK